jgi:hypothetical protein
VRRFIQGTGATLVAMAFAQVANAAARGQSLDIGAVDMILLGVITVAVFLWLYTVLA